MFVAPVTGGKPTILQKDWEGMFEQIIWQDPGQVHFIGSTGAESVYGIIKTDAKSKPVFQSIEKGFAISHFELAANGRGLFLADSYNHPTELFIEGAGQTAIKRMTDSNPVLKEIDFAKQEVVRYKAKDGLKSKASSSGHCMKKAEKISTDHHRAWRT
ncbi:MAG: hypothetical protein IPP25_18345 [Saprospiraceae bacterium]|nr:hypothetical protein [Candidatus Opimibacter skivensis]